jgi:hypothetical protein
MQPGGTYSILCPVNALRTDRVLATNSETGGGVVIAAFPLRDQFGHVVIHIRNILSVPKNSLVTTLDFLLWFIVAKHKFLRGDRHIIEGSNQTREFQ